MGLGIVILGRQGSGKGTQAVHISEKFGVVHISTGDMLREAVAQGTEFGVRAKEVMDAGDLVSDDIMIGIVEQRLAKPDVVAGGFLLDGFPRTPAQAEALLGFPGVTLDLAINIDVPESEVTARMLHRGRDDDTPESIARRLELYEAETAPLLSWFEHQGILAVIDGIGGEDDVFARIRATIESL